MSHAIRALDVIPAAGFYLAEGEDAGDPLGPLELNQENGSYIFDADTVTTRLWFEERDGLIIERSDPENPGTLSVEGYVELVQPPYKHRLTLLRSDYVEGASQLWFIAPFHGDFEGAWTLQHQVPDTDPVSIWATCLTGISTGARVLDGTSTPRVMDTLVMGDTLLTLNSGVKPITGLWRVTPEKNPLLPSVFCEIPQGFMGESQAFVVHPQLRFFDYQRKYSAAHAPSKFVPFGDFGTPVLPPGEMIVISMEAPEVILVEGIAVETLLPLPQITALLA